MKSVLILVGSAIVLMVVAYGSFLYVSPDERSGLEQDDVVATDIQNVEGNEVTPATVTVGKGTLAFLQAQSGNLECTIKFSPDQEGFVTEGTFFHAAGNIRADFLVPAPDLTGKSLSSVIIDQEQMYSWAEIDGEMYGAKMSRGQFDSGDESVATPVSFEASVTYNCVPWEPVDQSIFLPPNDVLFRDIDQLMEAGMEYGTVYEEGEF